MGKETPLTSEADPLKKSSDEAAADRGHPHVDDEPLQARGPDPRDEVRSDQATEETHGKAAGGLHHDKTPRVLVKQAQKHKAAELGRPKDTGRAGA